MKKIVTFVTAVTLAGMMSATAFAADYSINQDTENKSPDVDVNLIAEIPSPSYMVEIPAKIDFDKQTQALAKYKGGTDQYGNSVIVSKDFEVKAIYVKNLFDDVGFLPKLDVSVEFSGNFNGTANAENTVPYTVYTTDKISSGTVIGSFKNSDEVEGEQKLTGSVKVDRTDITKTDLYKGTMTFTMSVPKSTV